MVDTHCHLDHCEPPVAELVERARDAGLNRLATVGMDGARSIAPWPRRMSMPRCSPSSGATPTRAPASAPGTWTDRAGGRHPKARVIGETGLDYYRDYAPRDDQRRAFEAQLGLAARLGMPVAIHTRAAEDDTFALLREHAGELPAVILHCFSAPDRLEECVERGYLCSFAGNVTYPKAAELQQAAPRSPPSSCWWRPTHRFCSPQVLRSKRNEPAFVVHTAHHVAGLRGTVLRRARAHGRGQLGAGVRVVSGQPRQASLRRLRRVRGEAQPRARPELPDRRQHPRGDRSRGRARKRRCGARGRRGPGRAVGVPRRARRSPPRGRDRRIARGAAGRGARAVREREPASGRRGEARPRRRSRRGPPRWWPTCPTAWRRRCCSSRSPSCPRRPSGWRWSSARWPSAWPPRPGGKTYGATSVLAQLACQVRLLRRVPRTVFHPEPNVESALLVMRRRRPGAATRADRAGPRRLRSPAQGPGRVARPRARAPARACGSRPARRSERSGCPPTPGPSAWRRRSGPRLADAIGRERIAGLRPR